MTDEIKPVRQRRSRAKVIVPEAGVTVPVDETHSEVIETTDKNIRCSIMLLTLLHKYHRHGYGEYGATTKLKLPKDKM
jgi:hypothetical protein